MGACAGSQKCKDGYVQVAVGGVGPVSKLVDFFGFKDDPDFQPFGTYPSITRAPGCKDINDPLPARAAKFRAALDEYCLSHTVDEVNQQFSSMGVPVSPHMTYERMLKDPQYKAREVFVDCFDEVTETTVKQVNMFPKFAKHPGQIVRGGAKYDADTADVMAELGYTPEEVEALYEKGVLKKGK